ncbi:hypothetical protein WAI453_011453 [Rhynchosporium graminicola]
MATRIFMTGITGYIGGQALATLIAKHPEHTIIGLVRTEEKKQQILARHPSLEVIIGDLDSDQILIEESKKADIVISKSPPPFLDTQKVITQDTADADHLGAINSLLTGLSSGKKGTYLHLSGAGSVFDHSLGYGKFSPKIWDDIEDLTAITTFRQPVFHAKADRLVLDLGKKLKIRTAILEPPMVYGNSDSLSDRSISLPLLVDVAKARGKMFQVGEAGGDVLTEAEALEVHPWALVVFATNMRTRASRLRALGWVPKQPGLIETVSGLFKR